jgi:hypothetical protein
MQGMSNTHTEVTLALNILLGGCQGDIHLSVLQQPCFLWEQWLNGHNVIPNLWLIVPPAHKKLYSGCKIAGLKEIDEGSLRTRGRNLIRWSLG